MKNILRSSLVMVSVLTLFLVAPLASAATSTNSQPTAADLAAARKERIAARKLKFKIKLTISQETKLKGLCKASQKKVTNFTERSVKTNELRAKMYAGIEDQLSKLITKLKLAEVTTDDLDADQEKLATLVKTYSDDYTSFQTNLKDLADLECQSDPEAFQTALQAARADRKTIVEDAVAIRTFVNKTVKKDLKAVAAELNKKTDADKQENL